MKLKTTPDVRIVFLAWKRILSGQAPLLSIEITRECPLHCPGCYAYSNEHLGGAITLRQVRDLRGESLVKGTLNLIERFCPVQVSFVGGEPLVRHWELPQIPPLVRRTGVSSLVVTSLVLPFPEECTFTRFSRNLSADLRRELTPCLFGGNPDCSQCGCAVRASLHFLHERRPFAGLKAGHLMEASLAIEKRVAALREKSGSSPSRRPGAQATADWGRRVPFLRSGKFCFGPGDVSVSNGERKLVRGNTSPVARPWLPDSCEGTRLNDPAPPAVN